MEGKEKMIKDYFALAIKNLRRRKLRSWLTMIGIFISVATIFLLISLSLGLQNAVEEQFRLLGADKFFIQPKGQMGPPGSTAVAVQLTTNDVDVIEKVSGVKDVSYSVAGNGKVIFSDQTRYLLIVGIPLDKVKVFEEISAYKADEGSLIKQGDRGKVMVGSRFKEGRLFQKNVKAGDTISINGREFKIKTILEPIGNSQDDSLVYMELEDFKEVFNSGERVDQIMVQIENEKDMKDIAERVNKKLMSSRNVKEKTKDFSILTPEELLKSFGMILNIITGFLLSIAAISLLVGGIGIANTMYTSVIERTREIGVMKAIGARNSDVMLIFLIEAGLLGFVGGIIGVGIGIVAGKIIEYIAINNLGTTLLQVGTPLYLIFGCLLFSFLIGAISGLFPSWRASKTNVVDALRYE